MDEYKSNIEVLVRAGVTLPLVVEKLVIARQVKDISQDLEKSPNVTALKAILKMMDPWPAAKQDAEAGAEKAYNVEDFNALDPKVKQLSELSQA